MDLDQVLFTNYFPNCSKELSFKIFAEDTNVFAAASDLNSLEKIMNGELEKVK